MKVIVISGPTASGKTQTALDLARKFGGEIVNFDSLLLYQEINIGTAKPTVSERKAVPHHLIDVTSISNPLNASQYANIALPIVNKLHNEKKIVYLVGGSGFYLQALLKGMYDSPSTPNEISERSNALYIEKGIDPFLDILKRNDPKSFERYHANDHYRIRRAVEHWWSNGTPLSEKRQDKEEHNKEMEGPTIHGWEMCHIYLDLPKEEHLEIIKKRTNKMVDDGLVDEVKALLLKGFTGLEKPLQSIGYKETLDYIFGVHKNLNEYLERIVISTRQLAKSQRTWFKKDQTRTTFHPLNQKEDILNYVQKFLQD